ncbi:MAG: type II toxin-antitoxin system RelE/ParE family toxin [Bacteroidales bacterium]|nr:type II toxin-antitoxin system RelE/ParE family toxin [Bacteroidales bacterium]
MRILLRTAAYDVFVASLPEQVRKKVEYVTNILINRTVINTKFVKKLENTPFYEMRISMGNEYRVILLAVDNTSIIEAKQVIMLNGFVKK